MQVCILSLRVGDHSKRYFLNIYKNTKVDEAIGFEHFHSSPVSSRKEMCNVNFNFRTAAKCCLN